MQERIRRFLSRTGMDSAEVNIGRGAAAFAEEMRRGLDGEPSSLLMLPTWLRADGRLPVCRAVTVIDVGGTNLRTAEAMFTDDGICVEHILESRLPAAKSPVSVNEFFDAIAGGLAGRSSISDTVGFCFSFPAEILPTLEGRVLGFDKEILVEGASGVRIGEQMNRALERRGILPRRFILLNDTAATLLGGMIQNAEGVGGGHIGYILGTGTNIGYLERCAAMRKDPAIAALPGRMAVNVESGGYSRVVQGEADLALDAQSADPGRMKLEKMLSGRYLSAVIARTVRIAARDGLFSAGFARRLEGQPDWHMAMVNRFLVRPGGDHPLARLCQTPEDTETLAALAINAIDRAARLTAMTLAATMERMDDGKDPARPVCVTAEGTTFAKTPLLRARLEDYLREVVGRQMHRYGVIRQGENVTLAGTAAAVWLNR